MNQAEYERELKAFDEKIALAKLEESKANQRVRELEYQKARFCVEISTMRLKENQTKG